jgi:hypothetical protein
MRLLAKYEEYDDGEQVESPVEEEVEQKSHAVAPVFPE